MKKLRIFNKRKLHNFYDKAKFNLKYPNCSMVELIMKTASKYPDNIAYEYFGNEVSYKKFIEQIESCAKSLKINGVKEGDAVTICTANTPEGIIMFYAVNMVGAIANMVHPLSSEKEIEEYLNLSKSKFILIIDMAYEKLANVISNTEVEKVIIMTPADGMSLIKSLFYWFIKGRKTNTDEMFYDNVMVWNDFIDSGIYYKGKYKNFKKDKDPAVILYSGGTTGTSKGVLLSNKNFNALAIQSKHIADNPNTEIYLNPGDSTLSIMPIFHGFGLGVCIHTPLNAGMKCILIPNFNANDFPYLIKRNKPSFIAGVPTLFEALTKCKTFNEDSLKSVNTVISGGDILKKDLKFKVDNFLSSHGSNANIKCGYGLTEATGATSVMFTSDFKDDTIGIPLPDTYYKIVKPNTHEEVENGTEGEICISGPTVMLGYINNEEETLKTLRRHEDKRIWLHTGDIGLIDNDGLVYFKQRLKRIIISSGYNIYPSHIESIIESHPSVQNCVVVGVDHPYKVQVAKAFIVLKEGIPESEAKKSIKKYCEKYLSKYSRPYIYEFKKSIPKTKVGKIAYTELK